MRAQSPNGNCDMNGTLTNNTSVLVNDPSERAAAAISGLIVEPGGYLRQYRLKAACPDY